MCVDNTSIMISPNLENFETKIDKIFGDVNNWFKVNQLILNYNKTHYLEFNTKNSWDYDLKLNYQGKYIKGSSNTKFWGLIIDDSLWRKAHTDQMISKLNTVCFVIPKIQAITSQETLRMVYFAFIHSIMSYRIIFWGNQSYSGKIFKIKKKVIRIITNSRMRDSCRELFKKIRNTALIFSIYLFTINICEKKHLFYTNNQMHSIHTRFKTNLHLPTANLTKFQKGVYYSGIKIFNNRLHNIKDIANEIALFLNALKRFLLINSFYSHEECFNYQRYSIEN